MRYNHTYFLAALAGAVCALPLSLSAGEDAATAAKTEASANNDASKAPAAQSTKESSVKAASASPFSFDQMSKEEKAKTGVEKLTQEERQALEQWIETQASPAAKKDSSKKKKKPEEITADSPLKENNSMGRYLILENGMKFEVAARNRKKSSAWKPGDMIRITTKEKSSSAKLENLNNEESFHVKISK